VRLRGIVLLTVAVLTLNNNAYAFDSTPPKIDSCSVSPNYLPETGGTLTVTVHITSSNGLMGNPVAPLYLEGDTTRQLGGLTLNLASGDTKSGVWVETINVAPNLMPGQYQVTIFPLTDLSQNSTGTFYLCPGAVVSYGQPSSQSTNSTNSSGNTSTNGNANSSGNSNSSIDTLQSEISQLNAQLAGLQTKLSQITSQLQNALQRLANANSKIRKICSSKKKVTGC
jgi:outer membrane murein-binding lipoprotein Lpp